MPSLVFGILSLVIVGITTVVFVKLEFLNYSRENKEKVLHAIHYLKAYFTHFNINFKILTYVYLSYLTLQCIVMLIGITDFNHIQSESVIPNGINMHSICSSVLNLHLVHSNTHRVHHKLKHFLTILCVVL